MSCSKLFLNRFTIQPLYLQCIYRLCSFQYTHQTIKGLEASFKALFLILRTHISGIHELNVCHYSHAAPLKLSMFTSLIITINMSQSLSGCHWRLQRISWSNSRTEILALCKSILIERVNRNANDKSNVMELFAF